MTLQQSSSPSRRAILAGAIATTASLSFGSAALASPGRFFNAFGSGGDVDHSAWTSLLQRYVKTGADGINRVDYRAFKASGHQDLKVYVASLAAASPRSMTSKAAFAYWVNLYNAVTIDVVLDHYPVKSIRDIRLGGGGIFGRGPWKKPLVTVEGQALSLDDIEHNILRPIWRDPRIHYAVNCASIGCPNLETTAFASPGLSARLDRGAQSYINHPRGVRVEGDAIRASKIYDWFSEDFGGRSGLIGHWTPFARADLKARLAQRPRIAGFDYDWALNDV